MDPLAGLLSTAEVADLLRVSHNTVTRWVRDGLLPGFQAGRQYRIRRVDLDAFLGFPNSGTIGGDLSTSAPKQAS